MPSLARKSRPAEGGQPRRHAGGLGQSGRLRLRRSTGGRAGGSRGGRLTLHAWQTCPDQRFSFSPHYFWWEFLPDAVTSPRSRRRPRAKTVGSSRSRSPSRRARRRRYETILIDHLSDAGVDPESATWAAAYRDTGDEPEKLPIGSMRCWSQRRCFTALSDHKAGPPRYYQVFSSRCGKPCPECS